MVKMTASARKKSKCSLWHIQSFADDQKHLSANWIRASEQPVLNMLNPASELQLLHSALVIRSYTTKQWKGNGISKMTLATW